MSHKGGKAFQPKKDDSQKSARERAQEFAYQAFLKKDETKTALERLQNIIEEQDKQKEQAEKILQADREKQDQAFEDRKKQLEDDYKTKSEEAEQSKKEYDQQKKQLDEKTHQAAEEARRKATEEVKSKADSIIADEKEKLLKEANEYAASKRKEADNVLLAAEHKLSEAEEQFLEYQKKRTSLLKELDEIASGREKELSDKYQEKIEELKHLEQQLRDKEEEVRSETAEIEEEKEYIKNLRQKYNQFSEKSVTRLTYENAHLEERLQGISEENAALREENVRMQKYLTSEDGEPIADKIDNLERALADERARNDELSNLPSASEIDSLRRKAEELEDLRGQLDESREKCGRLERQANAYVLDTMALENERANAEALRTLNHQLEEKLQFISEQYKNVQQSKFPGLLGIDKQTDFSNVSFTDTGISLKELVGYVRNYGASMGSGLFYSEETIRVFIASLAASEPASRLLILQGLSGTGKSSLPRMVCDAMGWTERLISVQPSWRDDRELLGYDNDFTNRFKETEFTKYLYEASEPSNQEMVYLIVLDEMNLARIEYYFADFLSVLEDPDKNQWMVPLVTGYTELSEETRPKALVNRNNAANIMITPNVWFVGTANNDDSTSMITDKVYDRAQILDMDKRENDFKPDKRIVKPLNMSLTELHMLFSSAHEDKTLHLGNEDWENIEYIDEILKEMGITFGNRIKNQMEYFIPVYMACGGSKEAAVDYILTHKILRKLDERYEPYLLQKLKDLKKEIGDIYGEGKFENSLGKIDQLINKINPGLS